MEIERKFLIAQLPQLSGYRKIIMSQHYLSVDPVMRIRKADERYIFTYKSGEGMVRQEEEFDISEHDFERLLARRIGNGVYKTRYVIPLNEKLRAEVDVYEKQLKGLCVVEVEFENEQEAKAFTPPAWFGKEVTEDPSYTNAMLALGSMKQLTA
ncbi:MAG: CYTH domain-containing protein [Solobacterium sp.]|nr:CYTH domain-containing protein [Solobacterium sp.]